MRVMFVSGDRSKSSAEYSVVVFPLPVGPVTRTMPCDASSVRRKVASDSAKPEVFQPDLEARLVQDLP